MKILITAAGSHLGRALARELIQQGYEVYGMIRPSSTQKEGLPPQLNIIECDLAEPQKLLRPELEGLSACVHLAWGDTTAAGRMDRNVQQRNTDLTMEMIPVLKQLGCARLLFAGSQAEYGVTLEKIEEGKCSPARITEEAECDPVSEYGKAKLRVLQEASRLCRSLDMTYIHLRIFSTYGPGQRGSLVKSCLEAFSRGEQIVLTGCAQNWNYLYVDDCAAAISELIRCVFTVSGEDASEHVVNVASEDTRCLQDFVREIRETVGKGSYVFGGPGKNAEGTPYLNPDTEKLKQLTGFAAETEFKEGIKKYEKSQCGSSVL